jgi:hypothetical protein
MRHNSYRSILIVVRDGRGTCHLSSRSRGPASPYFQHSVEKVQRRDLLATHVGQDEDPLFDTLHRRRIIAILSSWRWGITQPLPPAQTQ